MLVANQKPALVLDDDRNWACYIARGIRRFGGLPTVFFPSVEAFLRHYDVKYGNQESLANVLREYDAVIIDNNFEASDHEVYNDGWIRGMNFLYRQVGPAVQLLEDNERPILVSFAPPSEAVIKKNEKKLWDKYRIVSFHKLWETLAVGIDIRIAQEFGVVLSRESLISNVLGQSLDEDEPRSPKAEFFLDLRFQCCDFGDFPGEGFSDIEGEAKPLGWEDIISTISRLLDLGREDLVTRINAEVEQTRLMNIEGNLTTSKER